MPKLTIMEKISNEQFKEIVKNSFSIKEVGTKCGYSNSGSGSANIVKARIEQQQLDISHFKQVKPKSKRTEEEVFTENSEVDQATLRKYYTKGEYTPYVCAICGQEPFWNDKPLTLTLDHINGFNHDNRFENLRWICPNCDRQLDTYGSKNIKHKAELNPDEDLHLNHCLDCGVVIDKASIRCQACSAKAKGIAQRKVERISREELKSLIRTQSFTQIARQFGLTDNAIRKWCDGYDLPRTKKEIQAFSDEEWQLI